MVRGLKGFVDTLAFALFKLVDLFVVVRFPEMVFVGDDPVVAEFAGTEVE